MNRIDPRVRLPSVAQASVNPRGYGTTVVLLAMAALGYLVYYLYQKHLVLSDRAQAIRNSFTHFPQDLDELDMINLAREVESLQKRVWFQPNKTNLERFQIKIFPSFHVSKPKKFIVELKQNHTCRVQWIDATLGRGGFGKVVRLFDLHTGGLTALKIATPPREYKYHQEYNKKACDDLKKEHKNLGRVHAHGNIQPRGVQDKPLSSLLIISKQYKLQRVRRLAYEGTLYEGSLDKLNLQILPLKTRLGIALQVLQGMETLLTKKLISHDLKPENILYRRERSGNLQAHVSDLGGVTHESELPKELESGLAHTPAFADSSRIQFAQEVSIGFVQRNLVRNSEKCSIGLTVFSILTGRTATIESTLEDLWHRANLPLHGEYQKLFSTLKDYCSTGFFSGFFKTNISQLREMVEQLYKKC